MSSIDRRETYWRSLREREGEPPLRAPSSGEFRKGAADTPGEFSRRRFLQLLGASAALAGFSGCRWPKEEIVPYARRPENAVPGEPLRFATSWELRGWGRGLLVTSYDRRPVKVEGNELDPVGRGAASALDQASLLDLYDPDRSRSPGRREGSAARNASWDDFAAWTAERLPEIRARRGAGLVFLAEPTASATVAAMRARIAALLPEAVWLEYDPLSMDREREGSAIAFGRPMRARLDLASARVILSLDADLLDDHPAALRHARDFAEGRRIEEGRMNRLYVVESVPSVTGSMADHRLPLAPRGIGSFALALLREIAAARGTGVPPEIRGALDRSLSLAGDAARFARAAAADLAENAGRSVVAAGYRQPPEIHAAAHLANALLGNIGRTAALDEVADPERPAHFDAIRILAEKIEAGSVDTLVLLGGNPAYDAPSDLGLASLIERVPNSVRLGTHGDETARACAWRLPRAHFLESWGDARAYDGTLLARQPLLEPLYGGKSDAELLALLLDGPAAKSGYDLARDALRPLAPAGIPFETFWRRFLHDGVHAAPAPPAPAEARPDLGAIASALGRIDSSPDARGFDAIFLRDASVHDGRFANNAWLQEAPDPMTKLTWDNAAILGVAAADALGARSEDLVRVRVGDRELDLPVHVLPGVAPGTVALPLGYGRRAAGRVGDGVGFDAYALRGSAAPHIVPGAAVEKTGGRHALACTEDHHRMDPRASRERERRSRILLREVEAAAYRADPKGAMRHGAAHETHLFSLWKENEYPGPSWGMAIDLNACIGCGACVVACQAENNVPVVGKRQVRNQREMHWIRIDRYFRGDPDAPDIAHQPVACVHCENAPCEQVCPVAATVHTSDGLNAMVYNRCIGTRYCSNNCPYKVRRFNFFNYRKKLAPTEKMAMNPEVTVRSRGVMEKCTYCVQRIEAAKIRAKNENRPVRDGEIVPACAQACPTRAIVFGDLADGASRVARLHGLERAYRMLEELNVKPRTAYLARLRNPNPLLAEKDDHEPARG